MGTGGGTGKEEVVGPGTGGTGGGTGREEAVGLGTGPKDFVSRLV